jgi:hypothetical protein
MALSVNQGSIFGLYRIILCGLIEIQQVSISQRSGRLLPPVHRENPAVLVHIYSSAGPISHLILAANGSFQAAGRSHIGLNHDIYVLQAKQYSRNQWAKAKKDASH